MKIKLTYKAFNWLTDMVGSGEWKKSEEGTKALKRQYRSGVLLFDVWPELEVKSFDMRTVEGQEAALEYAGKIIEIEIPEKDEEMLKECFEFFVKKGLPTTRHIRELEKLFGTYKE